VRELAARSRALAAGVPVPDARPGGAIRFRELEELGASFDAMAHAVRARQEALVRSERSFRTIIDTPLVGVVRNSLEGTILFANEAMARMLSAPSAEALRGRNIAEFYADPGFRGVMPRLLERDGKITNQEVVLRTPEGPPRTVLVNVARDGESLVGIAVDISDLKEGAAQRERLEHQLERAQRVEAVGRLAGGVAHDLNNVLTAIVGYAHMLTEAMPAGHPDRDFVDGIMTAAGSATALTRSLLAFSRKHPIQAHPVDVSEVVRSVVGMLGRLLGEDVKFVVDLPSEPLTAVADPARLEQVLVNLGTNARDAMPGGGLLTIAAAAVQVDAAEAVALGLAGPGRYVQVSVRDTGEGMSEEVKRQAFEPFFTTKAQGKGTGLGLSIVHGIVRQHGGAVSLQSDPGAGTTVNILLPATAALPTAEGTARPAAPAPVRGPGGHETILVAEDEPAVRDVVVSTLARAGYQVIQAGDGAEAVARFRERISQVDLCLLDVIMPNLNGREVLQAIRKVRPDVPVLLMSGFTGDVLAERGLELEPVGLLQKPMAPGDLLERVRRCLDGT
jgi:two-component system NtrC family sensor kinase